MITKQTLAVIASVAAIATAALLIYDHYKKKVPVDKTPPVPMVPVIDTRVNNSGQKNIWDVLDKAVDNLPELIHMS